VVPGLRGVPGRFPAEPVGKIGGAQLLPGGKQEALEYFQLGSADPAHVLPAQRIHLPRAAAVKFFFTSWRSPRGRVIAGIRAAVDIGRLQGTSRPGALEGREEHRQHGRGQVHDAPAGQRALTAHNI